MMNKSPAVIVRPSDAWVFAEMRRLYPSYRDVSNLGFIRHIDDLLTSRLFVDERGFMKVGLFGRGMMRTLSIEYLVAGGAGAGRAGGVPGGGGGGAGGIRTGTALLQLGDSHLMTCGLGQIPAGVAATGSSFGTLVTSGAGPGGSGGPPNQDGVSGSDGGSGGGGGAGNPAGNGGSGTTSGAAGDFDGGSGNGGGGGGSVGGGSSFTGGNAVSSSITGSAVDYGRGGGGGRWNSSSGGAPNGGGIDTFGNPGATPGSGGGGGGGRADAAGGQGADGCGKVRYIGSERATGGTISTITVSGTPYTLHEWTPAASSAFVVTVP